MFNFISKELNVNGNICNPLEKYFKFLNKHEKQYAKEFDSENDDYREINQKEKTDYAIKKLNMLPIHKELSKINSIKTQMGYGATSLNPSARWDKKSVYPRIESGFAFKPHLNDVYVEAFNNQTFNQDGDETAVLRIKYYKPPNLMFQHLPVKEKVKKRS